ncbi:MAG TPA: hypothetical protein VL961_03160 [Acidimicrobiales bacterium]|nr:hypothetical protein [Acidimicrobiales bacterium]
MAISFVSDEMGFGLYAGAPTPSPLLVLATVDAGRTWRQVGKAGALPDDELPGPNLLFAGERHGFVWGIASGGLLQTSDGGRAWTAAPISGTVLDVVAVGPRTVAALSTTCPSYSYEAPRSPCSVALHEQTLGSEGWRPLPLPPEEFGGGSLGHGAGGRFSLSLWEHAAGGEPRQMLLSSADGGSHWEASALPCSSEDPFGAPIAVPPHGSSIWLVCTGQGTSQNESKSIYRSTDGGANWIGESTAPLLPTPGLPRDAPCCALEDFDAFSAVRGFMLTTLGGPEVTADGGSHWTRSGTRSELSDWAGIPGRLDFVNQRDGWLTLVTDGLGVAPLWRTTDGGRTWSRV